MKKSEAIIIGSVLGDGNLKSLSKKESKSQLYVSQHSSKLSYLEWLHLNLKTAFDMNPIRQKSGYQQHYFMTKPNELIGDFKKSFYPLGKKIIPKEIKQLLRYPISLAVWYMDDGNLDKRSKYHCNSCIATYSFTFEECNILSKVLSENFNLKVSVTKCTMRGKLYPRLYIWSESMDRFISLVKPFIHPVFNYKIQ